jgi:hypothetical protein
MTEAQVEKAIRQTYRLSQKIETQRGEYDGMVIEMWVNKAKRIIETAYTVY